MTELEVTEKRCPSCGEVKSFGEFYKNSNRADGLYYECKTCARPKARERARQLRSTSEGLALVAERRRRSYAKDPTATKNQQEARQVAIKKLIDRHRREFNALYKLEAHTRGVTVREVRDGS